VQVELRANSGVLEAQIAAHATNARERESVEALQLELVAAQMDALDAHVAAENAERAAAAALTAEQRRWAEAEGQLRIAQEQLQLAQQQLQLLLRATRRSAAARKPKPLRVSMKRRRAPVKKRPAAVAVLSDSDSGEHAEPERKSRYPVRGSTRWRAQLKHNRKLEQIGYFDTEEEAARAVAKFLWANGRGGEASFTKAGDPQAPRKNADCLSRYRGVGFNDRTGKWTAHIKNPKTKEQECIGSNYKTEEEAADAYNAKAKEYGKKTNVDLGFRSQ
jgi:hypothetical protein